MAGVYPLRISWKKVDGRLQECGLPEILRLPGQHIFPRRIQPRRAWHRVHCLRQPGQPDQRGKTRLFQAALLLRRIGHIVTEVV